MTKAVLETESEGEAQRIAAAVPSPALAVPPSLQASLMARLDRLGAAKEVVQIGAAIGREFSYALLAAVTRKSQAELRSGLDRLVAAGLLFQQGEQPHASYLFKHRSKNIERFKMRVEVEPDIEVSAMVARSGSERTHVRFL